MWDPYAEFQSATLPNGLRVHAAHWPGRPWEAMGFLIHSGAEHDPVGREGLAHFVEHLVSHNTIMPKEDIRSFFEDCGGIVALGRTGYPYTYYRFFVPADRMILARAFSIFGHMLFSVKFEQFIEREREVIIQEFHRDYPLTFRLDLDIRQHQALYRGYWLERFVSPLGNPESVGQVTPNELQTYYDTHYTPANMSVVGVGGMQLSELVELLSESPFAANKKGARTSAPVPATHIAPPSETRHVCEVSKYIHASTEVGGYKSVATIPGNVNERIIRIMQEMLNKVLNEEVRERRAWTYTIHSSRHNFRYFHKFSIDCGAFALKAIDDIGEVIEVCITSVAHREDLFEQVKRSALARNFMIDPTGKGTCDGALDDLANNQRIISLAEVGDDIARVTMSDIRQALQWLRPERRWTLITRP